jgi:hypothetical protein
MGALYYGLIYFVLMVLAPVFALPDSWVMSRYTYPKSKGICYLHALLLNVLSVIVAMWVLSFPPFRYFDVYPLDTFSFLFQILMLLALPPASQLLLLRYLAPTFPTNQRMKILLMSYGLKMIVLLLFILIFIAMMNG